MYSSIRFSGTFEIRVLFGIHHIITLLFCLLGCSFSVLVIVCASLLEFDRLSRLARCVTKIIFGRPACFCRNDSTSTHCSSYYLTWKKKIAADVRSEWRYPYLLFTLRKDNACWICWHNRLMFGKVLTLDLSEYARSLSDSNFWKKETSCSTVV